MNKYFRGRKIIYAQGYPAIYKNGKVIRIHILIMEEKLGRKLKKGEVIHHKDENKLNYSKDNLLCFATNAEHCAFHKGAKIFFDEEGIAHCKIKGKYDTCPVCGKIKSIKAEICKNCADYGRNFNNRPTSRPEKSILISDLEEYKSIEAIGRKYSVTGNAVKKWLKFYNLYEKRFTDLPEEEKFIEFLKTHTQKEAAEYYNVPFTTVQSWIIRMNLYIIPPKVLCVETKKVFNSFLDVARIVYPNMSPKSVGNYLGKVVNTDKAYHNYHWKMTDKIILKK